MKTRDVSTSTSACHKSGVLLHSLWLFTIHRNILSHSVCVGSWCKQLLQRSIRKCVFRGLRDAAHPHQHSSSAYWSVSHVCLHTTPTAPNSTSNGTGQMPSMPGTKTTTEKQACEISLESFATSTNYTHRGLKYHSWTLKRKRISGEHFM